MSFIKNVIPALCLLLTGCFTGVESTPKIKSSEIKKQNATTSADELVLASVHRQSPALWEPGKRFYVTDNKISLVFLPSSTASTDSLAGKQIAFAGFDEITSVTGEKATEIVFVDANADRLIYRVNAPLEQVRSRSGLNVPFTVEMSQIDQAQDILKGNIYYITTSRWFDATTGKAIANNYRHLPVKIENVLPGNDDSYPLKVVFSFDSIDSPAARTKGSAAVFLSTDSTRLATRGFASVFTVSDPRLRYPQIRPEIWQKIMHSQIQDGMTRDECRLALGAPDRIVHEDNNAGAFEYWTYSGGTYLMFQDNLLTKFRL